ncbi:MAG: hypothetical protein A2406_02095 [Candidatus Komeilibacteria bacterium RIFOXYC1_FULL_37_11]|uniref:tRNA/rRNA methyltransferase SpoU type domain-containing protein n=1 Tax=Candidatus Komeilibacteria bacterium RIFOXYC1_FULL_37_11 TaxID=1798555 RepID=A0A1G2BYR9_9BACT|nr:MAG: hypothetical protein A2406_02095 [Candidatus Komeilibacteria bacterium RIFOXYC1_FULL_37_11]OGY95572.1 MAG: hypothetical protein A2611_02645 [Candidatus Komeilibacteria bacterium RIFOXYD1_FULL_37_29]
MNNDFYIIAHNIRSLYNVGTMFRTADGLGADRLFLTGYSGYPPRKEISKVALGADQVVPWEYCSHLGQLIKRLKKQGVKIIALETDAGAIDYLDFKPTFPMALLVGNEVRGISKASLALADSIISLPMKGSKESLNVGVAMAVAGYHIIQFRQQ